jgi:hypothetical protein
MTRGSLVVLAVRENHQVILCQTREPPVALAGLEPESLAGDFGHGGGDAKGPSLEQFQHTLYVALEDRCEADFHTAERVRLETAASLAGGIA